MSVICQRTPRKDVNWDITINRTGSGYTDLSPTCNGYDYFNAEQLNFLHWCFVTIIYPVTGVIGIAANTISLVILTKSGLRHASNILLFCLTLADMACLLNAVNVPLLVSGPTTWGIWQAPYLAAAVITGICSLITVIAQTGSVASAYITIWITVERMLAIFCTLRFNSLVTPMKVWMAGLSCFVIWCPWMIYMKARDIIFKYGVSGNFTGGMFASQTSMYDTVYITLKMKVYFCFSHLIPFLLVSLGSTVISLKLAITRQRRRRLMALKNESKSSGRLTKTLLMVCLLFSIMHVTSFFSVVLQGIDVRHRLFTLSSFYILVSNSLIYGNSAINFFVYVAFNNKFRNNVINLFDCAGICRYILRRE